jgi:hypothetical protein
MGADMAESITITLPKTMPLTKRVSEVNLQLSEWIESLEPPFNVEKDTFQLRKFDQNENEYSYQYIISRDTRISGNAASSPYKFETRA